MVFRGVAATVRILNPWTKIRAIPRGRDNTDYLVEAEMRVHQRLGKFKHPDKTRRGSLDIASDAAYNGNVVSAPPQSS